MAVPLRKPSLLIESGRLRKKNHLFSKIRTLQNYYYLFSAMAAVSDKVTYSADPVGTAKNGQAGRTCILLIAMCTDFCRIFYIL